MPSTCCAKSQGNIIPLAFLDTSTGAIEREPSHRSHPTVEGRGLTKSPPTVRRAAAGVGTGGQGHGKIWVGMPALPLTSEVNLERAYDLSESLLCGQKDGDGNTHLSGLI